MPMSRPSNRGKLDQKKELPRLTRLCANTGMASEPVRVRNHVKPDPIKPVTTKSEALKAMAPCAMRMPCAAAKSRMTAISAAQNGALATSLLGPKARASRARSTPRKNSSSSNPGMVAWNRSRSGASCRPS